MQKKLYTNRKALSTIALILLLLISAIVGGVLSYLWTMGYYLSLKEKIPDKNTATIVDTVFQPQNASHFNVTIMNPSFSPDEKIQVVAIALSLAGNNTLFPAFNLVPRLPFNLSRGQSQSFSCTSNPWWSVFVNKTGVVSVFVNDGTGSTMVVKLPYTELNITSVDFNPIRGVKNFTVTVQNRPLSAAYLNITRIVIDGDKNMNNYTQPSLPSRGLDPNDSITFTINYDWLAYATIGGSHKITVYTKQGYLDEEGVEVPRLAFSVQEVKFDPSNTTRFSVKVFNQVSTNTPLNVTKIEATLENGTTKDVTPPLTSSTNGVLGNQSATFTCAWNWTTYRNKNVIATVHMLQGVKELGQKVTPFAAMLNMSSPVFSDTQHFLVTVKNSQYSIKTANVTKITVTLENGTERDALIVQPSSGPYPIGIGETTMFGCLWNWENYLNKTININIYTDEGLAAFRLGVKTPMNILSYGVYLNATSATFNVSNTAQFDVTVHNSISSDRNATITKIAVLLENGTELSFPRAPFLLAPNATVVFFTSLDWSTYRNKNIVILIYTDEGQRAIYKTKTPS